MKSVIVSSFILCVVITSFAQDSTSVRTKPKEYEMQTLFGKNSIESGGYGAFMMSLGRFNDQEALMVGARGGWIINHYLSFGLGGYGLTTPVHVSNSDYQEDLDLELGYGGFYIEPIIGSKYPVHVSIPILIGAGGASIQHYPDNTTTGSSTSSEEFTLSIQIESDGFFILEPGINVEFNFTKFLRVAVGGSYLYIDNLDLENVSAKAMRGPAANFTIKLGKF